MFDLQCQEGFQKSFVTTVVCSVFHSFKENYFKQEPLVCFCILKKPLHGYLIMSHVFTNIFIYIYNQSLPQN